MSRLLLILTISAACAFTGCSVQKDASAHSFQEVIYEKTLCFGPCPAFIFHVLPNGMCEMEITRPFREGALGQLKPGNYTADLSKTAQVWNSQVESSIDKSSYLIMKDLYDNPRITDLPSTITILYGKSVTNRYKGPDLSTLYTLLDESMASLNWIPNTKTNLE